MTYLRLVVVVLLVTAATVVAALLDVYGYVDPRTPLGALILGVPGMLFGFYLHKTSKVYWPIKHLALLLPIALVWMFANTAQLTQYISRSAEHLAFSVEPALFLSVVATVFSGYAVFTLSYLMRRIFS